LYSVKSISLGFALRDLARVYDWLGDVYAAEKEPPYGAVDVTKDWISDKFHS
jgi:hypothetical protein